MTLDFKYEPDLLPLLDRLDEIVLAAGGRHYLAKDARMSAAVFRQGYPNWHQFKAFKDRIDPAGTLGSLQSDRLGLTRRHEVISAMNIVLIGAGSAIATAVARRYAANHSSLFLFARNGSRLALQQQDLLVRGAARVGTRAGSVES